MATSIAVTVNWTANFIVGLGFLPIRVKQVYAFPPHSVFLSDVLLHQQEALGVHGPLVFIIFSVFLAFFVAFTFKKVPETKNKTIEEISAMFRQRSYQ